MSLHTHVGLRISAVSLLVLAGVAAQAQSQAQAQEKKNCIELKNEVQVEQEVSDAQGNKTKKLVAPGKIVPGNEVVYTMTASNVCDKPAANVVINNPVPQHMTYVMNSAMGVGTAISYSLDGKAFAELAKLTMKNADGSARAARAEDIKAIRWVYATPINPGQTGFVRFRARVQ